MHHDVKFADDYSLVGHLTEYRKRYGIAVLKELLVRELFIDGALPHPRTMQSGAHGIKESNSHGD